MVERMHLSRLSTVLADRGPNFLSLAQKQFIDLPDVVNLQNHIRIVSDGPQEVENFLQLIVHDATPQP